MVLDGKLTNRVKVDESMWNVDRETSTLCINLEKSKELMWKSVLEGEKEIDITKVETYTCRRSRVRLHISFINEKCFQSCPHRAARATQCRIES